jgi:hypothetical protein
MAASRTTSVWTGSRTRGRPPDAAGDLPFRTSLTDQHVALDIETRSYVIDAPSTWMLTDQDELVHRSIRWDRTDDREPRRSAGTWSRTGRESPKMRCSRGSAVSAGW